MDNFYKPIAVDGTNGGDFTFFSKNGKEMLKIVASGDFYVQGNKVVNDIEVYNAFREFLRDAGQIK